MGNKPCYHSDNGNVVPLREAKLLLNGALVFALALFKALNIVVCKKSLIGGGVISFCIYAVDYSRKLKLVLRDNVR